MLKYIYFVISLSMLFWTFGCQAKSYPLDHEQLSQEERIVIRFSHVVGEETPKGLAARKFAELMHERTDGFVEVQVFPNGYLYKDGEEIDALLKGDLQMIAPATSKVTEFVPEWMVMDLPFAFETLDQVHEYLYGPVGQELMNKLTDDGMLALGVWDNGFKQITNNRNPVIDPEDVSGLRFRIMPSDVIDRQFRLLGAIPEVYAFNEVFQLLENNEIDAQENTLSNISSKNIHTLQQYLTISNHGYLGYVILVNYDFWQQLPEDIRVIFQETLAEVTEWEMDLAQELNQKKREELTECQCIEIHEWTEKEREQWEEALKPVYSYYIDRFGAKYIEHLPVFKNDF